MAHLTKNDLAMVKKFLFGARKKWYNIGLELNVKSDKLDDIKDEYGTKHDECLREMLKIWLKSYPIKPTWNQLAKALAEEAIEENELAALGTISFAFVIMVVVIVVCVCVWGGGGG